LEISHISGTPQGELPHFAQAFDEFRLAPSGERRTQARHPGIVNDTGFRVAHAGDDRTLARVFEQIRFAPGPRQAFDRAVREVLHVARQLADAFAVAPVGRDFRLAVGFARGCLVAGGAPKGIFSLLVHEISDRAGHR
jgi:hypothetical protein